MFHTPSLSLRSSLRGFPSFLSLALVLLLNACSGNGPPPGPSIAPDVVDLGYGETHEDNITGAISTIKVGDEPNVPYSSVAEMIVGKAPGVQIQHSPRGPEIVIRGQSSFMGNNAALIILDGMPAMYNVLSSINPHDVLRITVLKDAASTAIYGSRGANGVVLIRTKRAGDR